MLLFRGIFLTIFLGVIKRFEKMNQTEQTYKTSFLLFRQLRRKTQLELAEELKISPAQLYKYEQGIAPISDSDLLNNFALSLKMPVEAFTSFSNSDYRPIVSMINFRTTSASKNTAMPAKRLDELDALANIIRWRIDSLVNNIKVKTAFSDEFELLQMKYKKAKKANVQKLAEELRQIFGLNLAPIENVVKTIEQLGVFVLFYDAGENLYEGFDGFSTTLSAGQSLIVVNSQMPPDRIRLTLVHELAHCLLHNIVESQNEQQAWDFAAEFLTPRKVIENRLNNLTIGKLSLLKKQWKVSMGSLIMRAKSLGTISDEEYSNLWKIMSRKGYRFREPIALEPPREEPTLLKRFIEYRRKNEPDFDLRKTCFIISDADYSAFNFESGETQPKVLNLSSI